MRIPQSQPKLTPVSSYSAGTRDVSIIKDIVRVLRGVLTKNRDFEKGKR